MTTVTQVYGCLKTIPRKWGNNYVTDDTTYDVTGNWSYIGLLRSERFERGEPKLLFFQGNRI